MLKFPADITAQQFLKKHWQKQALFMPGALNKLRPRVSRNELGWLATLDDVESRIVFVNRDGPQLRYTAKSGPFDPEYLQGLPRHDWTLLVHDVEKHLPAMRALFDHLPFIPQWRIDDLMVSFAAPGGGVGPHRDNYDVFLCQGIGRRHWRFTTHDIIDDADASNDLALVREFDGGASHAATEGDVLYLPPGVAHWGVAQRACITYSIGMRAPQASDLTDKPEHDDRFYTDPDLQADEARGGCISRTAIQRAGVLLGRAEVDDMRTGESLGRFVTQTKHWITPDGAMLEDLQATGTIYVHGMARIAFDDTHLYVNGASIVLPAHARAMVGRICDARVLTRSMLANVKNTDLLRWMLERGAFELNWH